MGASCCCPARAKPKRKAKSKLIVAAEKEADDLWLAVKGKDFSFAGMKFTAKVVEVYDGDTIRVKFDYRGERIQYKVRMNGYDSPEMKPLKTQVGRDREIEAAHQARDALKGKIGDTLVTIECGAFDKYGRILATVYLIGENVNQWMLNNKYGVPYDGGTKTPFSPRPETPE